MAIDIGTYQYISIQPDGGFGVSKRYAIDISARQIIDKTNGTRLPYDINSKILVYEDRQKTWFFDVAEYLKMRNTTNLEGGTEFDTNEAGFVILMVAVSYLESNQKYRNGLLKESSTGRIKKSLKRILPQMSGMAISVFINGIRNGLFHEGITKKGVFINASQSDIFLFDSKQKTLIVNPNKFLKSVEQDFIEYIQELKNNVNNSQNKFEGVWNTQKGI